MKYKTLETSREARLWLGQIIIPGIIAGMTVLSIPGVKEAIGEKIQNGRDAVKSKFNR